MNEIKVIKRRVGLIRETQKAFLFKFKCNKKTFWIPKKYVNICNQNENPMTGYITYTVEIEKWLWNKINEKIKTLF